MKLTVTEKGLLIPKEILGEDTEFEIIQEDGKIIISSIKRTSSIWDLGKNPVECDVETRENHPTNLINENRPHFLSHS